MEEVKPLLRPFRCCSEAILRYAGDIDPRLVDVVLVGRVPEKNGGSARVVQEGPICASLIEKKFEIKLHTSPVGEYIVGSYLRNNVFGIELRNDGTDVIDGEEYAVLTIEWRDLFLEALIAKRDADVKAATTRRDDPNELEKVPMPVVEQPVASDLDAL